LPFTARTPWPRRLDTPLRTLLRAETGSAGMLLLATAAALVWTNVDAASYERVWRTRLALAIGHAGVSHDLHYWLSSGLMTLFSTSSVSRHDGSSSRRWTASRPRPSSSPRDGRLEDLAEAWPVDLVDRVASAVIARA
jgi:hypothetical protein